MTTNYTLEVQRTNYTLEVYGRLWDGAKACSYYSLDKIVSTYEEASRVAGDFAQVIDWRLVKHDYSWSRQGRTSTLIDTKTTLRGWRNGMTCQRFYSTRHSSTGRM